jgi:choline-sulfatase
VPSRNPSWFTTSTNTNLPLSGPRTHTATGWGRLLVGAVVALAVGCNTGGPDRTRSESAVTSRKAKNALGTHAPAPLPPAPPKTPPRPLNVLLLTIDAFRADHAPWLGYARPVAPNLTKLAEQAVLYTNAYSISSYTAKSIAGMLAGKYPSTLYRSGYFFATYAKSNVFFPEVLQEHGIRTLGWQAHLYFARGKGFDQGFDVWKMVPGITFDPQTDHEITSEKTTKLGLEILGNPENTGKQFFAWAHYMDPHDVYNKHPECPDWGKKNRDRYDSEICFADSWLGKLVDWAKTQPWWKDTALIVTSDHGEVFGEHGMYRHAFELWEPLVRVPLLIMAPGSTPKRIGLRRSTIDLAPTIMELMGQKPIESFQGKSLVPEVYGTAQPDDREPIVLDLPEDSNNPFRQAFIEGDYKLIALSPWQFLLFNLAKDPAEEHNLATEEPETFARMKQRYAEVFAKIPYVQAYGGNELVSGKLANGPMGPEGAKKPRAAERNTDKRAASSPSP